MDTAMLTLLPTDSVVVDGEAEATARHPEGLAPATSGALSALQATTTTMAQHARKGFVERMHRAPLAYDQATISFATQSPHPRAAHVNADAGDKILYISVKIVCRRQPSPMEV
jgi:hypothetical protein